MAKGGEVRMPSKILRSLIQEQFSFDSRVQMDLLSRRRDISNKEKQEELFHILRTYGVDDVVPLGPGTNRYAFKLNGFVIKFATDNDGKIDNFKEFKMAKILYPDVTRAHEVTENGTILVAEYIQPFESYFEMRTYADQIRNILKRISSLYLIGDVGITEKNYVNWGIRVGTNRPVCLDFAYVYSVKSKLFICPYCQTNSMIVPNEDFTHLICSNPKCGRKYLFEDIRRKIGNDVHAHEIGDLTLEGYLMNQSHILTELDPSRSNYLKKKIVDNKESEDEHVVTMPKDFVMSVPPSKTRRI